MSAQDKLVASAELYRTQGRGKLHVRGCSHLQSTDPAKLVVADDRDRADLELCSECDKEIRGIGRVEYPSLDRAFEALKFPVENRRLMQDLTASVDFERIWAPQSRSYIAAGFRDERPVAAYLNKGFVHVRLAEGWYQRHEMPTFAGSAGGTARVGAAERGGEVCRTCFVQLPVSGICDECG